MHQEAISSMIRKFHWQALRLSFFHPKVLKTSYFSQQTSLGTQQGVQTCWPPQPSDYLDSIFPQKCPFDSQKYFLSSITHNFQSYAVATCGVWWAPQALFTPSEAYGHLGSEKILLSRGTKIFFFFFLVWFIKSWKWIVSCENYKQSKHFQIQIQT